MFGWLRRFVRLSTPPTVAKRLAVAVVLGLVGRPVASTAQVVSPGFDLDGLFELGGLVADLNGDSVPDFVDATLVLGPRPDLYESLAATEIAARLGFETMAMNLPLELGVTASRTSIVVGRSGLAASGLAAPGVDPTSLDDGEGAVALREEGGRTVLLVLGGDGPGLVAAARFFAGVLPHTRTLSSPRVGRVREDLSEALATGGVTESVVRLTEVRVRSDTDGLHRLIAEVGVTRELVDQARLAVSALGSDAPPAESRAGDDLEDAAPLAYEGLESVEVRIGPSTGQRSPVQVVRLSGRAEPDRPGPVAGRPGSGTKRDLDLSTLYTPEGLLGDSDSNLIPDRVDALLVLGDSAVEGGPTLSARLGLESTGIVVPLAERASDVERPASQPTLVLMGQANRLTRELADSGRIALEALGPGDGLIELGPEAFGPKPALVVTGADASGAARALEHVALTFPNLDDRGRDQPTLNDVESDLWATLSGHTPAGQAAIALYKLDRIAESLADRDLASVDVLVSLEKPDPDFEAVVRRRAAVLGSSPAGEYDLRVTIDDRDVRQATTVFQEDFSIPGEVGRFWTAFRDQVLPLVTPGSPIRIEARISEPPEVRRRLESEARDELESHGAHPDSIEVAVLSAFKQGYSWLYESVRPRLENRDIGEVVIRFRRNEPPPEWPQQAMLTPVRWLHEIFPIDEILARDLELPLERISFVETTAGPTYEAIVTGVGGDTILVESFDPRVVVRPYFDRYPDYELVRVTTGWMEATSRGRVVFSERIRTDAEWFWDHFQSKTLGAVYDYVMDRHDGIPRGGAQDAPFFGELRVELELSEPDYLLDLDKELISPLDAVHEEIYFGTIELFHLIGRNSRGQDLTYPGRIMPIMRPIGSGGDGRAQIRLTGFATSRPAVVVRYTDRSGGTGEIRLDIPKIDMPRPSARRAVVRAGVPGIERLDLRIRVDAESDERSGWLQLAPPEQVDERMISAAQVEATIGHLNTLRQAGLYTSALAFDGLREIGLWAEWTHEQDPDSRRTVLLTDDGEAAPAPDWRSLLPEDWTYDGSRLVQWDTPIPPPEGHRILAQMASTFDEASIYRVGQSYLGKDIWALDLMPALETTHWSMAKATTFKPTVVYSARQHANEVSSTSHVLRHAELLLTDPGQRRKLDRVNVVIHPFTNPDGAQLAYDLYRITPEFILHAGYLGALGMDATSGSSDDHPIYPESTIRDRLWRAWLPDIFLNPHGYPSHQVVQLFSEYTGLVRRGRVTERNWGFNKGWFMPGFGYVDDPRYPRHKDAAFSIRDYITRGINSDPDVFEMNQRSYDRYRRYGASFDPDVFRVHLVDSVMIDMPLKGSSGQTGGRGFSPEVTIWSGTTEAPDETAHGPWMELVAKAGLSWDQAILDYLYEGEHVIERSGTRFFGGVALRMNRPRPPTGDEEGASAEPTASGRNP
jgi:hypothetical protein